MTADDPLVLHFHLHRSSVRMLDLLKSLSDLSSLQALPWRWWISLAVGIGGMSRS